MLAALDSAFAFLISDYGFERTEPEQCGRELDVSYCRLPFVSFTVICEPGGTPFIVVSARTGEPDGHLTNKPLRLLAKKRNPDWVEPRAAWGSASDRSLQAFFENYAALLKESFTDLLTAGSDGSAT